VKSGVPDEAAALGEKRREEISRTGADIVISSCPFCEYHLREHTDRPVKNVATLLLEGYREKDRRAKEQKPC
jgi:fumarate reductase (CoM/CoB) subunit B